MKMRFYCTIIVTQYFAKIKLYCPVGETYKFHMTSNVLIFHLKSEFEFHFLSVFFLFFFFSSQIYNLYCDFHILVNTYQYYWNLIFEEAKVINLTIANFKIFSLQMYHM